MNPWLHFAALEQCNTILSLNSILPSLLVPSSFPKLPLHYVPISPTMLPHYSPTFLTLPPHSTHTPFPPCHPTLLTHLSHLPSSLLSHFSELTSLPTTSRNLQYNNILSLGRQGKHVWLIVRQPLMKAGWWDAPLALRDLAKAISIFKSLINFTGKHLCRV